MSIIEERESAYLPSDTQELPRHELEGPELTLCTVFFPYGFPVAIRTNCADVLTQYAELWGKFEKQHDTVPLRADVRVVESSSSDCPPAPTYRVMSPLLICVADPDNYAIVDLERCHTSITVSQTALQYRLYAQYFILGMAAACVATHHVTPVHAGCVAWNGHGVLLCGDSGAGKSTLSYACARAGWTYISDDASYLMNGGGARIVSGNCHQVRFRPTAVELFPELVGLEITLRAAGKPSIELPTEPMTHISRAQAARVDFIVFLNRHSGDEPRLLPYSKDKAREAMRQVLYGPVKERIAQFKAIEKLLTAEVFELRYADLGWAIRRLQALVEEGR